MNEEKLVDVSISPGSKTGNRIQFKGEGNQIVSVGNYFLIWLSRLEILSKILFILSSPESRFKQ